MFSVQKQKEFTWAIVFPGVKDRETQVMRIIDMMLSNSQAGLIDLNLNQQQKVLQASCFPYILSDYSTHILIWLSKARAIFRRIERLAYRRSRKS